MKKAKIKLILNKLIYIILAIMATIGIIFIMAKTYPKIEIAKEQTIVQNQIKLAEGKIDEVRFTTSRGNDETRKAIETKTEDNKEKNVNKQSEKKVSKKSKKVKEVAKNKKDTTKYISINEVRISRTMDLTKRTGLSREDFIKLISRVRYDTSGFFRENAGTIYDLCKKYNINEIFFCGLISAESGWNIASNHRRTHNYISLMSNGRLIQYGSVYQGLEVAAQKLHYNYLTPGGKFYYGKTLAGVKTKFCPSSTWINLVYGRMSQII